MVKQQFILPLDLPAHQPLLKTIRNLPEFAQLFQFVSFFRKLLHLNNDDVDIELLEEELVGEAPSGPASGPGNGSTLFKIFLNMVMALTHVKRDLNSETVDAFAWSIFNKRLGHKARKSAQSNNEYGNEQNEQQDEEQDKQHQDEQDEDEEESNDENSNPFGASPNDTDLNRFVTMSAIEKIKVLFSLSRYISLSPSFRDKVDMTLSQDHDSSSNNPNTTSLRVDPVGWKGEFGVYYLLDDNRLYYLEESAPNLALVDSKTLTKPTRKVELTVATEAAWKIKNAGKKQQQQKGRKRQQKQGQQDEGEEGLGLNQVLALETPPEKQVWKCVCVTLADWEKFIQTLKKSRTEYDREFYKYLNNQLLPVLRDNEERRISEAKSRIRAREKQYLVVNRKRSSRLEEKKMVEQEEEVERRQRTKQFEDMVIEEQLHKEREKRMRLRDEKRRNERLEKAEAAATSKVINVENEADKIKQEKEAAEKKKKELAKKKEAEKEVNVAKTRSSSRLASRHQSNNINNNVSSSDQQQQQQQQQAELYSRKNWDFDCYCGVHGRNYDDGKAVVECEGCEIWLHVDHLKEGEKERLERSQAADERKARKKAAQEEAKAKAAAAVKSENGEGQNDVEPMEIDDEQEQEEENEEFVCDRCLRIRNSQEQKEKREARKREKEQEKAMRKKRRMEMKAEKEREMRKEMELKREMEMKMKKQELELKMQREREELARRGPVPGMVSNYGQNQVPVPVPVQGQIPVSRFVQQGQVPTYGQFHSQIPVQHHPQQAHTQVPVPVPVSYAPPPPMHANLPAQNAHHFSHTYQAPNFQQQPGYNNNLQHGFNGQQHGYNNQHGFSGQQRNQNIQTGPIPPTIPQPVPQPATATFPPTTTVPIVASASSGGPNAPSASNNPAPPSNVPNAQNVSKHF